MREFKFRAWDRETKKMFIVMSLAKEEQAPFCLCRENIEDISIAIETETLDIMQFTGLLDKNGSEIYEGDFVKAFNEIWEIKYFLGAFNGIKMTGDQVGSHYGFDSFAWGNSNAMELDNVKVIGNIYENKNLLDIKGG